MVALKNEMTEINERLLPKDAESMTTDAQRQDQPEEGHKSAKEKLQSFMFRHQSIKVPIMIIASEVGNLSQLSSAMLAANFEYWTVFYGGAAAYLFALIMAMSFGGLLARSLSVNLMNISVGVCFLLLSVVEGYNVMEGTKL